MTTKGFFKPEKKKITVALIVGLITSLNLFFLDSIRFFPTFFIWPWTVIANSNVSSITYPAPPPGFPAGEWDPAAQYSYFVPPSVAIPLMAIATIVYWYLLACLIVWLFSLRKKSPTAPQQPEKN